MKNKLILTQILFTALATSLFADNDHHDGQNVSGRNFSSSSHVNSSWIGCTAIGTIFSDSLSVPPYGTNTNYTGANFTNANLTNASLHSGNFTNANFTNAILNKIGLATLTGANFTNATINGASFKDSTGFTTTQLVSTASYQNKDLSYIAINNGIDISGLNLTDFNITGTNFSGSNLLSTQLYSTANYKNKNLYGVGFYTGNYSGWNFVGQNMQNTRWKKSNIEGADASYADLRGAGGMSNASGAPIYKNTIMSDGKIQNFSMTSSNDNFSIRKYVPRSEPEYSYTGPMISAKFAEDASVSGGAMLTSAKFAEDASVSGGAMLTLEQGAEVEVVDNATLSFGADSSLLINTDKDGSTIFSVESGAGLTFVNGATLTVNIIDADSALNVDGYKFAVMNWNDDSRVTGLNDFVIDTTLFLTLNGINYDKAWSYYIKDNQMFIEAGQVPEPATYAALLGALALGFAAWRKRK